MIEVSVPNFIFITMTTTMLVIFVWWLYYGTREWARRRPAAHTRIYRCAVCNHVYVDARDVPLARCDRCGCLNEAIKR